MPVEVEAVWVVLQPKSQHRSAHFNFIAVCSYYYADSKRTPRGILYDHIAETCNIILAKYGEKTDFILSADSNKLNLNPIINMFPSFCQVVKVPTRLNPPSTLDTIITSLAKYYNEPVAKPPLSNDSTNPNGKPSDHLVVYWSPISCDVESQPREYRQVSFKPITDSGLAKFSDWLNQQNWSKLYHMTDVNEKTIYFQNVLLEKHEAFFPSKTFKVSKDDKPWISKEIKCLDRQRKREFIKNLKSGIFYMKNICPL